MWNANYLVEPVNSNRYRLNKKNTETRNPKKLWAERSHPDKVRVIMQNSLKYGRANARKKHEREAKEESRSKIAKCPILISNCYEIAVFNWYHALTLQPSTGSKKWEKPLL